MLWSELSWPEIGAQNRDTPVVIPLGSCEQHGHHLPVFVDTIQVQAVADGVHGAMSDRILMLPAVWVGSSHHHIDYPGTISLPPELYTSVIKHIAGSVLHAGFKRLFFLNGHGGNEVPVSQAWRRWWRNRSRRMTPTWRLLRGGRWGGMHWSQSD